MAMRPRTKALILAEARRASSGAGVDYPADPTDAEASYLAVFNGSQLGDPDDPNLGDFVGDLNNIIATPVNAIRSDIARAETALKVSTVASCVAAGAALLMLVVLGSKGGR